MWGLRPAAWAALDLWFFLVVPERIWIHDERALVGKVLVRKELKHESGFSEDTEEIVIANIPIDKERSFKFDQLPAAPRL